MPRCFLTAVLFFAGATALAVDTPSTFTYQGRLVDGAGAPIEASNVEFAVNILSPSPENCRLMEETHSVNMSGSNGVFTLHIGAGTRVSANDAGLAMAQIFSNEATLADAKLNCTGNSYTPSSGDGRQIKISFNTGSGYVTLAPNQAIEAVPYAINALNGGPSSGGTTDVEKLNFKDPTTLTISSGVITMTQTYHKVDTESSAADDDLDTINGGTLGDKLIILPVDSGRSIWITDEGNINTLGNKHYPVPAVGAELLHDGSKWNLVSCGAFALTKNITLNLNNAMTTNQINQEISKMPSNLGGFNLTIQFSDGIYDFDDNLVLAHFFNGTLDVFGNLSEPGYNTIHTNQLVILRFPYPKYFFVSQNSVKLNIYNLRVQLTHSGSWDQRNAFVVHFNANDRVTVNFSSFASTSTSAGQGRGNVAFKTGYYELYNNDFSHLYQGIMASMNGQIYSSINGGSNNCYGLTASGHGRIGKNSTQPTGTTANESVSSGGEIR